MSEKNKNQKKGNIPENDDLMEKIVSLCKRRGFIFQGSEIYGGLAGTYDYGHYGVALKNNIKQNWWKKFVESRRDMYGMDAAILMRQEVWQASGHVSGFSDPMVECQKCRNRLRADSLIENLSNFKSVQDEWHKRSKKISTTVESMPLSDAKSIIERYGPIFKEIKDDSTLSVDQKKAFAEIYKKELKKCITLNNQKIEILNEGISILDELIKSNGYIGLVLQDYLNRYISCPSCGTYEKWSVPENFNMMFQTKVGASDESSATSYLRPETAQGMFINFKNTVDAFHPKLPFGMAQIGKAFRNEITPRDFLFRQREFEQMEIEYFIRSTDWQKYFEYWKSEMLEWMEDIGIDLAKVHELEVGDADRAHYSKRTIDFEFDYPFGRKELFGLAYRTDFDLKNHKLEYVDEEENEKITPHVIEPTFGVDRAVLALLLSSYATDEKDGETREYLKLKPNIAPVICAVSPLLKNKTALVEYANNKVFVPLKAEFGRVAWDDNGNIGKRYRRQDEIGTPFCIVVDFDTLTDNAVTVRDRDTGKQERIKVTDLEKYIKSRII